MVADAEVEDCFGTLLEALNPFSTGGVPYYIYNDYADMWGLPAIALPKRTDGGGSAP
jgi:hypothetical protein